MIGSSGKLISYEAGNNRAWLRPLPLFSETLWGMVYEDRSVRSESFLRESREAAMAASFAPLLSDVFLMGGKVG